MIRKINLATALAAGLAGGLLSHYISPSIVLAQTQAAKDIKAQSFTLVDDKNNVVGVFKASGGNEPTVVLVDRRGREIWRAGVSAKVLGER